MDSKTKKQIDKIYRLIKEIPGLAFELHIAASRYTETELLSGTVEYLGDITNIDNVVEEMRRSADSIEAFLYLDSLLYDYDDTK